MTIGSPGTLLFVCVVLLLPIKICYYFFFLTHSLKRLGQLLSRTHHDHLELRSPFGRQWLQSSLHTAFCVNHQRALGGVRGVGTWQQSVGFVQESLCADSTFHCECEFLLSIP